MTDTNDELPELGPRAARFFSAVGYAVTRWAIVDRALFDLCQFALGTNDEKTSVVFYRSPSLKDHLMLTDALMRTSLGKRHEARWATIVATTEKLLPFRNDIVHNPPIQKGVAYARLGPNEARLIAKPEIWWTITTEEAKLLHGKKRAISADTNDLLRHAGEVEHLLRDIRALQNDLPKKPHKKPSPTLRRRPPAKSGSAKKDGRGSATQRPPPRPSQA